MHDRDRLDRLLKRQTEQLRDVLAPGLAGGRHLLHRLRRRLSRRARRQRLRELDVRRVVGLRTVGDGIFSGFGQYVELLRTRAADRSGVGRDGAEVQPETRKDARVGVVHVPVFALQIGIVRVEGVAVLHGEFAPAHDTEARPDLVSELGLYLVEMYRQLTVAADFPPRQIGNHFLVRGADAEIPVVAILEAQQLGPVFLPAPGLLPQLGRLHSRHEQLDRPGAVHFLAYDGLDLAHHPQAERHPSVDPAGEPANQPRT